MQRTRMSRMLREERWIHFQMDPRCVGQAVRESGSKTKDLRPAKMAHRFHGPHPWWNRGRITSSDLASLLFLTIGVRMYCRDYWVSMGTQWSATYNFSFLWTRSTHRHFMDRDGEDPVVLAQGLRARPSDCVVGPNRQLFCLFGVCV